MGPGTKVLLERLNARQVNSPGAVATITDGEMDWSPRGRLGIFSHACDTLLIARDHHTSSAPHSPVHMYIDIGFNVPVCQRGFGPLAHSLREPEGLPGYGSSLGSQ